MVIPLEISALCRGGSSYNQSLAHRQVVSLMLNLACKQKFVWLDPKVTFVALKPSQLVVSNMFY